MKDNVISIEVEDYKKKKDREAYWAGWNAAVNAYTPPLQYRLHRKNPQPKPWYHWYTQQR